MFLFLIAINAKISSNAVKPLIAEYIGGRKTGS
jgi:hypothetical protein